MKMDETNCWSRRSTESGQMNVESDTRQINLYTGREHPAAYAYIPRIRVTVATRLIATM